ncbi:MAG: hypothetical protein ACM3KM_04245 [Acidobacteriaceae bacterium]
MDYITYFQKPFSTVILILFVAVNIMGVAAVTLIPKPAQATYPTITLADVWQALKDVAMGIAVTMAIRIGTKFLTDFVEKIYAKFKIRNFLYYDQVLTNYYLTRYLADKISDPDLRQIYQLLNAAYITGTGPQQTGGGGIPVPDRNHALIPVINSKIDEFIRTKVGGVTKNSFNNVNNLSAGEMLAAKSYYYQTVPSSFSAGVSGSFGSYQSQAGIASKLETAVGTGLKSSRLFGASCQNWNPGPYPAGQEPMSSEAACRAAGGNWVPGQGNTSFLTDPAGFIKDFVTNAVKTIFDLSYDTENSIWYQIGSLIGNFISTRLLTATTQGAPLNEDPNYAYTPTPERTGPECTARDIDGDTLPDVYECTDGTHVCIYGGLTSMADPNCKGSVEANTYEEPPLPGGDTCPADADTAHGNHGDIVAQAMSDVASWGFILPPNAVDASGNDIPPNTYGECGRWLVADTAAWYLVQRGIEPNAGILEKPSGWRCIVNGGEAYSVDIIAFPDGYIYDVLGGGAAGDNPGWNCAGGTVDTNRWRAPIDPSTITPASLQQGR